MSRFCVQCGKPIPEDTAFCTACGARQPSPAPPATPAATPSAPTHAPTVSPTPASVAVPPPAAPSQTAPASPAAQKGSPLVKIAVVVLGIIALLMVAGIGTCVYVGYRVKRKVTEIAKEVKAGSNQPAPGGAPKYESRPYADCEYKVRTGFDDYVSTAGNASIPMKAQLTLTDIWTDFKQNMRDIEVLDTVDGIHSSTIDVSSKRLDGKGTVYRRYFCLADMIHGRDLVTVFGPNVPETVAGATSFTLSRAVFQDLKAGRPADMTMYDAYNGNDRTIRLVGLKKGAFNRIEPQDVPYNIIVNGDQKDLPSIHATGSMSGHTYEAWILDDEANPVLLKIMCAEINWHITFVKITFPVEKKIEQELAQTGHAEIYGIYFDFNSAKLRPESAPVLKEISDALKNNPNWKIMIDGHTDNVGGNDYNLRLSERRSEAVKQALISEYGISADRMTPEGFGASRPKATNDTIEGRALNRRVELIRQ
jgi:OmpA family protein/zinc ribbon protein